jgi:hypothetical protein
LWLVEVRAAARAHRRGWLAKSRPSGHGMLGDADVTTTSAPTWSRPGSEVTGLGAVERDRQRGARGAEHRAAVPMHPEGMSIATSGRRSGRPLDRIPRHAIQRAREAGAEQPVDHQTGTLDEGRVERQRLAPATRVASAASPPGHAPSRPSRTGQPAW